VAPFTPEPLGSTDRSVFAVVSIDGRPREQILIAPVHHRRRSTAERGDLHSAGDRRLVRTSATPRSSAVAPASWFSSARRVL